MIPIFMAYFSMHHPSEFNIFCETAQYGYQNFSTRNKHKYPLYNFDRLWRWLSLVLAIFGAVYMSYGLVNFLFGWLPFISYGKNAGGSSFLGIATIFLTVAVVSFIAYAHDLALKQRSKNSDKS